MYTIFKNGNINIKWDNENTLFSSVDTVEKQFGKELIEIGFYEENIIDPDIYKTWDDGFDYWMYNKNTKKKYYISDEMIDDFQYCKTVKFIAQEMTNEDFEILQTRNDRSYE